jgi:hypothetical protein
MHHCTLSKYSGQESAACGVTKVVPRLSALGGTEGAIGPDIWILWGVDGSGLVGLLNTLTKTLFYISKLTLMELIVK